MIQIEKKTSTISAKINGANVELKVKPVSSLTRAEFQAKLLDANTATIGNVQAGDVKVNLDVLTKKDLYLFVYTVLEIDAEERWKGWSERDRFAFVTELADAYPADFEKIVNAIKETCGDLV